MILYTTVLYQRRGAMTTSTMITVLEYGGLSHIVREKLECHTEKDVL